MLAWRTQHHPTGGEGTMAENNNDGAGAPPRSSRLTRILRYPFLPGMMATFADYLGMALLTPALPYFLSEDLGLDEKGGVVGRPLSPPHPARE